MRGRENPKDAAMLGFPKEVPMDPKSPQRIEYRQRFAELDVNHSGTITLTELLGAFGYGALGSHENRAQVQAVLLFAGTRVRF